MFFGQTSAVAQLHAAARQVEAGSLDRPRVICLVGRAGVGKTALVAQWIAHPPEIPLYAVQGHRYCVALLASAERAAWRRVLGRPTADHALACQAVRARAVATLRIAERNVGLLDMALDRLTLARAALFEPDHAAESIAALDAAVAGVRDAGARQYMPPALLARALGRALRGRHVGVDSAQVDLDEAWALASLARMPLFLADVHLHRARLFHSVDPYPWDSPALDLAAARTLIQAHEYRRRLPELADAEGAILGAAHRREPDAQQ